MKNGEEIPVKNSVTAECENIEQVLSDSEEIARGMIESSAAAMCIWQNGKFQYVSPLFAEMTGYSIEELIGTTSVDYIYPEDRERATREAIANLKGESGLPYEYRLVRKDGSTIWILEKVASIQYKGYRAAIGNLLDITRLKQAKESLRESERKYRTLLENLPQKIFTKDRNLNYASCNAHFARDIGIAPEELVGKTDYDFFPHELADDYRASDQRIMESGEMEEIEEKYIQDGRERWVQTVKTPVRDEQGKIVGLQGIFWDITERKLAENELSVHREHLEDLVKERTEQLAASEEKFRTLADFTYDWEYWIDVDGITLYVSPSCERITGYPPQAYYDDPHLLDTVVHPNDRQAFINHMDTHLTGKEWDKDSEIEFRIIDREGKVKWIAHACHCIVSGDDSYRGRRASNKDITERKTAEEEIRQRSIELEAANKELEAFSYSVSHDLRAPLRSIDGFSQALLEDYDDSLDVQGKDYLRRVRGAAQRMALLIDDMLQLSRITRTEMKIEKVNLTQIARSVIDELQGLEPERRVTVKIVDDLEDTADGKLITVVLENLLGNAWKFTARRHDASIEFGSVRNDGEKAYFVRDNGAGFDMAYADKLFVPFQRLHAIEDFPGTGVGLATVQRVIRRHGGKVWAEGHVDKGATFYFSLR